LLAGTSRLKSDDSIARYALQSTLQGHAAEDDPKNMWKRDLEKEMWTGEQDTSTAGGKWK